MTLFHILLYHVWINVFLLYHIQRQSFHHRETHASRQVKMSEYGHTKTRKKSISICSIQRYERLSPADMYDENTGDSVDNVSPALQQSMQRRQQQLQQRQHSSAQHPSGVINSAIYKAGKKCYSARRWTAFQSSASRCGRLPPPHPRGTVSAV